MRETGILFLGHGTRNQYGTLEFLELVSRVQKEAEYQLQMEKMPTRLHVAFGHAFLEFCEPSIDVALTDGSLSHMKHIGIVPVFLFEARHLKIDVPHLLSRLSKNFVDSSFVVANSVGVEDRCIHLGKTRILESGFSPETESGLVIVARGTSHPGGLQAFQHIVKRLQEQLQVSRLETGFLTGPGPSLEAALQNVRARGLNEVYVFPYLLFDGTLIRDIHRMINQWSRRYPEVLVKVAPHLGVHELLVESFTEKTLTLLKHLSQ